MAEERVGDPTTEYWLQRGTYVPIAVYYLDFVLVWNNKKSLLYYYYISYMPNIEEEVF